MEVETFMAGSATLNAGTLTLNSTDVFTAPETGGPECQTIPAGVDQVNTESLTATLRRLADGG